MKLRVSFESDEGITSFPLVSNGERDRELWLNLGVMVYEFAILEHAIKQGIQIMLRARGAESFEGAFSDAESGRHFAPLAQRYASLIMEWECSPEVGAASAEVVLDMIEKYELRNTLVHGVISHKTDKTYFVLRSKNVKGRLAQWVTTFTIEDVRQLGAAANMARLAILVPFKSHPQTPGLRAAVAYALDENDLGG